jgi:hypothetical protein
MHENEQCHPRGPAGLLLCLGWGATWFERHTPLTSPITRPLPMAPWEDPVLEDIDACLHLASDDEALLAQLTDELFGPGPLDQRARLHLRQTRTGFTGEALAAQGAPQAGIPPPLRCYSGSTPGCAATRPATHASPSPTAHWPVAQTMHVSRIVLDLNAWYAQDEQRRTALMFSPATSPRDIDTLTDDAPSDAHRLPALAARHGVVGHAPTPPGRARLHGRPRINRRDFATLDDGLPGTHFVSLQRSIEDRSAQCLPCEVEPGSPTTWEDRPSLGTARAV